MCFIVSVIGIQYIAKFANLIFEVDPFDFGVIKGGICNYLATNLTI